jgi:hypothetical protein
LMPNANASGRVCGGVSLAGVRYPAAVPDMSSAIVQHLSLNVQCLITNSV